MRGSGACLDAGLLAACARPGGDVGKTEGSHIIDLMT